LFGVQPTVALELSVVPLAFIPLSFAYAIVKYRLMDVEVLFKRGVVYTLASATVVGLYLAIFLLGTHYLVADPHSTVIAVLATLVVVLVFTPLKSQIQVVIDRLFYRERYNYRTALLAFSKDLNAYLDLDRLSERMVEHSRHVRSREGVSLGSGHGGELFRAGRAGPFGGRMGHGADCTRFTASWSAGPG
jgi:hypothetical protein